MSLGALAHNLVIVLTELIYPATNQLAPFLCLRRVVMPQKKKSPKPDASK